MDIRNEFTGAKTPQQIVEDSVCFIRGMEGKRQVTYSQGVFIGPDVVVTALHCIEGTEFSIIGNKNKETAGVLLEIKPYPYEPIDLAVLKLDKPIAPGSTPKFLTRDDCSINMERPGLASRFTGEAKSYPIREIPYMSKQVAGGRIVSVFDTAASGHEGVEMLPGYSGAPVFDSNGKIITLVTDNFKRERGYSPFLFLGPTPARFAAFMERATKILEVEFGL